MSLAPRRLGEERLDRVATVPNLLSLVRILLIPLFVFLIVHRGTELAGLLLLGAVSSTDWIDGYIARRTGQVSNLGKLLDPVADRLALGAAIVAFVLRDAVPLWVALLILVRDAVILVAGIALLLRFRARIDVRWIGKAGTFGLMWAVPALAWGHFELWPGAVIRTLGWIALVPALSFYYAATVAYAIDARAAVRTSPRAAR